MKLSRRTMLRGAGAALALPLLDAMVPGQEKTPPRRFVGMLTNMGILPEFFYPKEEGRDYVAPPYLEILKEQRQDLTVFSGVSLPGVDGGHASEKSFLTGTPHPGRGSFRNEISLDQRMAEQVGSATRFPSLVLMIGSDSLSLSWTRSGSMIPPQTSPLKLYQKLFIEDTPQEKAAALHRIKEDRSLLDSMQDQAKRVEASVGAADRERIDQFFTSVRDLEKRLAAAEAWVDVPKPRVDAKKPEEITDSNDLAKNGKALLDLLRLALETDSTRVVTVAASLAGVTAKLIPGVRSNTHELTHHGGREEKIAELRKIEEAQFRMLADFLAGLRGAKEAGGTLFDRTSVLYGTNMGSANSHSNDNLPVLLSGGGFKHAGHLAFDRKKNYPLSNLYLSLLHRMGLPAERFSSSTGTMKGLELT